MTDTINGPNDRLRDRIRGSLIGGAIGDALGYAIEFDREDDIFSRYGRQGVTEYALSPCGKALISDDTQMTLFTAEGVLDFEAIRTAKKPDKVLRFIFHAYQRWFATQNNDFSEAKTLPDELQAGTLHLMQIPELYALRAPGMTCLSGIQTRMQQSEVDDFIKHPINTSKGCGGVMRIAPIALYYYEQITPAKIAWLCAQAAAMTHSHLLGYTPAAVIGYILAGIMKSYPEKSLRQIVCEAKEAAESLFAGAWHIHRLSALIDQAIECSANSKSDLENIHALGEGWVGEETMAIAIYCALRYEHDFSKAVIAAVNHNGDSDSTGAVTGNLVGVMVGYANIDPKWTETLELKDTILRAADALSENIRVRQS